jgi:multidrug efflux pump subunit AcrB
VETFVRAPATPQTPKPPAPARAGFVAFFVDRPIFAAVVAILITLIGAISFPQLRVSQYPPIAPPTVFVSANYTARRADVVERTITLPIEEQVNGTEGMLYMSSTSANDGSMSMTITFQLGRDPDLAAST